MTSRLAISYLIFSQYSKIPVTYQISLLGQKAPANKVGVVANGLIFFTRNMLLDRKWGWGGVGGGGESSKKAEQAWPLQQLCTPRPLPRRHDPEPLGGLSPAEFRKFSKAGAEVLGPYPVLLDEIGESRGCHRTGRSFRDRIDQLVQLLCSHPCACSHELPTK